MKRPGGELRERTLVKLSNGPMCNTLTLFADIVDNPHNLTVCAVDVEGNEYEAYYFSIDVNRNLTANSWFKI